MNSPLHVEIVQKKRSCINKDCIKELVHSYLCNFTKLTPGAMITEKHLEENLELREHVKCISFCDAEHETEITPTETDFVYHVYRLDARGAESDMMPDASSDEELCAADVWALPAEEFHGLWESLVYDTKLKEDMLRFVETAFDLTDRAVDPNIVCCNRVVLLHGPPGTGKTSLCRALAQKVAIRLGDRFPRARLLEINAHGLFSKWFSESGKLIARLFSRVRELLEDRRLLACVLVDEVESLAMARRAALAGLEPSDSLRAVNALLTQLDRLRRAPNVLVLATSNLTGAIDLAFVDRADIKRLVGPPSALAAYKILSGCCGELMARGAVARDCLFTPSVLQSTLFEESAASLPSLRLWRVARAAAAARASARALRRLPFLALALHCRPAPTARTPSLATFVAALEAALCQHLKDAAQFCDDLQQPPSFTAKVTPTLDDHNESLQNGQ